jgi:hypothetical protein
MLPALGYIHHQVGTLVGALTNGMTVFHLFFQPKGSTDQAKLVELE